MFARRAIRSRSVLAIALLALVAGCESCPPVMAVTLGNGSSVNAAAGSGLASQANSTWAFYANILPQPVSFLGVSIPGGPGFLFRAEFDQNGKLVRVFDNQVLAPDLVGTQLFLDGLLHPMRNPSLSYVAQSYGAESGSAVATAGCGLIYSGPLAVARSTLEFSGTTSGGLLGLMARSDGTLRLSSEVNPLVQPFAPPGIMSQTVEIQGFGIREQ